MKNLRQEVKELKIYQDIKYNEIAGLLEVKNSSFYNWLRNQYEFSDETERRLKYIIDTLKEE